MSYHVTNLGSFGNIVRSYADIDGYVPEAGDHMEDFTYPTGGDDFDTDTWAEWVADAITHTALAEQQIEEWRRTSW